MTKFKCLLNDRPSEDADSILQRIFIFKTFTIEDFEKRIELMEQFILVHKTKIIIIDSIASVVRREFSGIDSTTLHERAMFLSKISSRLKLIAEILDVSVRFYSQ